MTPDQIMELIERHCGPDKMSKAEALDFLGDIASRIDGACEALREEMANED